ncbi:MAG: hypothetical protein AABY86_18575 [Bdellovibrionota bacterium]
MRTYAYVLLWTILLYGINTLHADEEREGFVVTFYDKKVKVITPTKMTNDLALSLQNSSLGQLSGKLVTGADEVITYFTLESKNFRNINVGAHLKKRVFIIPLNPPGQDIELKIGQPVYEIPPSEN